MKKYSQLADLQSLLYEIFDPDVRAYAEESIKAYFAEAYRSAIVSIWISVVLDLYQKFKSLSEEYQDPAAKQAIDDIDKIRDLGDRKNVASWEREIIKKAYNDVKLITETEYEHLERIQKDRHRCAHPVLDNDGFLFQPSPELTRNHIRTAIEILLSQPPLIGKALVNTVIKDIEISPYFPKAQDGIQIFLQDRHLKHSDKYVKNLLEFSLKKILFLNREASSQLDEENIIERYINVFSAIIFCKPMLFQQIESPKIRSILDRIIDNRIIHLTKLINRNLFLIEYCSDSLKERIKAYLQTDPKFKDNDNIVYGLLFNFCLICEEEYLTKYHQLEDDEKRKWLDFLLKKSDLTKDESKFLLKKILDVNIDLFTSASSFADGRSKLSKLIEPLIDYFDSEHIESLFAKTVNNQGNFSYNQLIDCTEFYFEIHKKSITKFPHLQDKWDKFLSSDTDKNSIHNYFFSSLRNEFKRQEKSEDDVDSMLGS